MSDDTYDPIEMLHKLTAHLVHIPEVPEVTTTLVTVLEQLGRVVLEDTKRTQIGSNPNFSEAIARLWTVAGSSIKDIDINVDILLALSRLTRNVAAGCAHNQIWITNLCEPNIRTITHFLTSFYNSQIADYHLLTALLAQCLVNMSTGNSATSELIWKEYKDFTEQYNIITRLLVYPEQKAVSATLVFILNSLGSTSYPSLGVVYGMGGRAIYIGLLEMADQIYENEERADQFRLVFQIFVKLFEGDGINALYASIQPSDDTISPHQITLLKLLDGYMQTTENSSMKSAATNDFLTQMLFIYLRKANTWMATPLENGQPNESLPQVATVLVLVSQMLSNLLISEQLVWEKALDQNQRRRILECLRSLERPYIELIVDVLRQLDQLLPRIQFGKVKTQSANASSPDELFSPDVSGFQFVKRDLVRLLAILVHDDKSIQARVREHGGVQVVLGLCAVDDRNPYIREHALFALRNLLHKNHMNQDIVRELEPMGKWDENGVLADLR